MNIDNNTQNINYKGINIRYSDAGKGKTVVLLHGFMESLEVWSGIAENLEKDYRVICIDLLGHGKSQNLEPIHTMELQADMIKDVLEELKIETYNLIGHSMGGYITLAFLEKYPEKIERFCLFHSSPFADSPQAKINRDREIEFIMEGRKGLIINVNIPKMFADENFVSNSDEISFAKNIALNNSNEGIIAALEGMKQRPQRTQTLKYSKKPFLLFMGKHDNHIPFEVLEKTPLPEKAEVVVLEHSGHMGFFEEKEKSIKYLRKFLESF